MRHFMKKLGILRYFLLAITLMASAAHAQDKNKTYIVATDPYFMPYTYKEKMGEVAGFDKDILEAIAKDQGFSFKMVESKWPEMLDALRAGHNDMVLSWVVKGNPQTKGFLDSDPYIHIPESAIGYLNKNLNIDTVDDLVNLRVGVVSASSDEDFLKEHGVNQLTGQDTLFKLYRLVGQGKLDAFVGDRLVMEYFSVKYPKHQLYIKPLHSDEDASTQPLVAVFNMADKTLPELFNNGLKNIKKNGVYQSIVEKWFGKDVLANQHL